MSCASVPRAQVSTQLRWATAIRLSPTDRSGSATFSSASGRNLQNLNLPVQPNGVDLQRGHPPAVSGARLVLLNAASGAALPEQCFDDPIPAEPGDLPGRVLQVRPEFQPCRLSCRQRLCHRGDPPAGGNLVSTSRIIPPSSDAGTAPFSVPACPGSSDDAVPATAEYCEATASADVPPPSVPPRTRPAPVYYLHLTLGDGHLPGHSQVFNNPSPSILRWLRGVAITKTSSLVNVTRGALVPYTITVTNVFGVPLYDMAVSDRFPAGFKYVAGSARMDGAPVGTADQRASSCVWDGLELQVNEA
jgi:large repetitive protein